MNESSSCWLISVTLGFSVIRIVVVLGEVVGVTASGVKIDCSSSEVLEDV